MTNKCWCCIYLLETRSVLEGERRGGDVVRIHCESMGRNKIRIGEKQMEPK